MEINILKNCAKLKLSLFILPALLLAAIAVLLYSRGALGINQYIQIQKSSFLFINHSLSQYPHLQYNLTQMGDASIFLSFLGLFIVFAPKIWESLLSGLLVSCAFSKLLKYIFAVPRPAVVLDHHDFVIVGKTLTGHNSLPSGHSVTIFTILAVLLFSLMPQKPKHKVLWSFFIIIAGLILAFTRVGIGAHYPLDVIIGSIIGYIAGLAGIFISRKYRIWAWIGDKKYYPIIVLFFLVCCICAINKIIDENLIIFYLSLASLVVTLFKVIHVYAKGYTKN